MKAVLLCILTLCLFVPPVLARTDEANWDGTRGIDQTRYALQMHEKHQRELSSAELVSNAAATDVGEIAVITGNSKTIIKPSPFDLLGKKISFVRNPDGSYNVKLAAGTIAGTQGAAITLGDDASRKEVFTSGFSFPFYGTTYLSVFINSDGNLTFKQAEHASTDRDLFRVLDGPPRLATFFNDLNPSVGGQVKVLQTSTVFRVTWNGVPEFGTLNHNTFQVNLFKNGNIDFIYSSAIDARAAITGISPGNTDSSKAKLVNFSQGSVLSNLKNAVLERFASRRDIDFAALLQEFHQTHGQIFDFVVILSDTSYTPPGAFAFFLLIQNAVQGIGEPQLDFSAGFGSPKVQGLLMMDRIGKYPADPTTRFLGENNTLSVMGQENGHRWLSYVHALINGVDSHELLGRDEAHWSFFMDTDASVMEGNDLRDNGNGTFTTVAAVQRYSKLDQYIMGLIPAGGVPSFFFVRTADPENSGMAPQVGVTIRGTRVNVNVNQIIQAEGPRVPSSANAQKVFREAFIYFIQPGTTASSANIAKIDNIRKQWQAFFHAKTNSKGTLNTNLP